MLIIGVYISTVMYIEYYECCISMHILLKDTYSGNLWLEYSIPKKFGARRRRVAGLNKSKIRKDTSVNWCQRT